MSIDKKNKDHIKVHGGVSLDERKFTQKTIDSLRFWTNHPTEKNLVDLHPFADGEFSSPYPHSSEAGTWRGPFSGRPKLIAELAPALEARCALLTSASVQCIFRALRAWWRLFDSIDNTPSTSGQQLERLESIAHLNELHEISAHRAKISTANFLYFLTIVNDARRLMRLPALLWMAPKRKEVSRTLIPDDQARDLKLALKQAWEAVRNTWAQNDAIRAEANRRLGGEAPMRLCEKEERLLENWAYFHRIQQKTGSILPTTNDLIGDWKSRQSFSEHGLSLIEMRAMIFPTVEEADAAYHLALANSGWNSSTLSNLDANSPFLLADHPKDAKQIFLSPDEDTEVTLWADKPRARGKKQFCFALRKNVSSTPMIVERYLVRVHSLREALKKDYQAAVAELVRMKADCETVEMIAKQVGRVQEIRRGCRSVWLYVDQRNHINWIDGMCLPKYYRKGTSPTSYLGLVLERLNQRRHQQGKPAISPVRPSDFRDIYARQLYKQSGGNIIAVMFALGHSRIGSTVNYLENNLFSAENDQQVRHFMTHLFAELEKGRVDLTILAQLVRHGSLTSEMEARLNEYRKLMKSRIGTGCVDPRHPPESMAPNHKVGRLCGTHRCLKDCKNAKFLPESLDGIAMRVEELMAMLGYLPRETWLRGEFDAELRAGEYLLDSLYQEDFVAAAREKWKSRIASGEHLVPGIGYLTRIEEAI